MARREAAPALAPSALLRKVRERLPNGWPAGLTVFHGGDLYHLDQAQHAILETLVPPEATEFGLTVYGDEKVSLSTVLSAARSLGMFSPSRVVLVREVGSLEASDEEIKALREYAGDPPSGSHLLIRAPVLDKRRKLHKALSSCGTFLPFEAGDGDRQHREARAVTREMAGRRGIEPDAKVVDFLLESCGGDLYRIRTELDKLDAWLGGTGKRKVGEDEMREIASGTAVLDAWEVGNAVLARDLPAALAAVRRLLDSGENAIQMLGAIRWRTSGMLQAKAMAESRRPRKEIVNAARAYYYADALMDGLGRYTLEETMTFPYKILRADRALKGSALDPGAVLERLLRELIDA